MTQTTQMEAQACAAVDNRVEHRRAAAGKLAQTVQHADADADAHSAAFSHSQARPQVPDLRGHQRRRLRPLLPGQGPESD